MRSKVYYSAVVLNGFYSMVRINGVDNKNIEVESNETVGLLFYLYLSFVIAI